MRLLTHNCLSSKNFPQVTGPGFPLNLKVEKLEEIEEEVDYEYIKSLFTWIDWNAAITALEACNVEAPPNYKKFSFDMLDDEDFLKFAHKILIELDVIEGSLECGESKLVFPIENGIPNMILKAE